MGNSKVDGETLWWTRRGIRPSMMIRMHEAYVAVTMTYHDNKHVLIILTEPSEVVGSVLVSQDNHNFQSFAERQGSCKRDGIGNCMSFKNGSFGSKLGLTQSLPSFSPC